MEVNAVENVQARLQASEVQLSWLPKRLSIVHAGCRKRRVARSSSPHAVNASSAMACIAVLTDQDLPFLYEPSLFKSVLSNLGMMS